MIDMYSHKTEGIVLRSRYFREADKIVTLYTREFGKLDAIAKGARRIKSKFVSSLEPFTHLELMIHQRHVDRLAIITGFDIIYSNGELRRYLDIYTAANYIGEIVCRFHFGSEKNEKIYHLLIKTLRALLEQDKGLVKMAFSLKFLAFSGYRLITTRCTSCKRITRFKNIFFSASQGGIICPACRTSQRDSVEMTPSSLRGLKSLELAKLDELGSIIIPGKEREEINYIINTCMNFHLGSELMTERFSRQLSGVSYL